MKGGAVELELLDKLFPSRLIVDVGNSRSFAPHHVPIPIIMQGFETLVKSGVPLSSTHDPSNDSRVFYLLTLERL